MSMFHMLNCAANFKTGYNGTNCSKCNVPDNESHRINDCVLFKDINLYTSTLKVDFAVIHSDDGSAIDRVLEIVCALWNLKNGKNEMKTDSSL